MAECRKLGRPEIGGKTKFRLSDIPLSEEFLLSAVGGSYTPDPATGVRHSVQCLLSNACTTINNLQRVFRCNLVLGGKKGDGKGLSSLALVVPTEDGKTALGLSGKEIGDGVEARKARALSIRKGQITGFRVPNLTYQSRRGDCVAW